MKITKAQLNSIIQEELAAVLDEAVAASTNNPNKNHWWGDGMPPLHKQAGWSTSRVDNPYDDQRRGDQSGWAKWQSQYGLGYGKMPHQTGDYTGKNLADEAGDIDSSLDHGGTYVDNPLFGAHVPAEQWSSMGDAYGAGEPDKGGFDKDASNPQGLGSWMKQDDWSEMAGDQLAASSAVNRARTNPNIQGRNKKVGMNQLGGNIFVEEQLKQMVREELKNLLESDK
tara:strand:- start:410 stop:1087 length:678 start_codon:yes stop_codon:yes gene_type:complete